MFRHARHPLAGLACRASQKRGLTLVELLLVLALLVVVASFSVPLMFGALDRAALHDGGDLVRAAWAKARLAAMQSGQTHVFRFEPGGSRFQVIALGQIDLPEANDLQPEDPDARYEAAHVLRRLRSRLPEGVVFAGGNVAASSFVLATVPGADAGPWSAPILFRPDGTTTDASLLLANSREQTIRVTLRGLTGISHTTDAATEATP